MKYHLIFTIKRIVMLGFAMAFLTSCIDYDEINTPKYLPQELSVGAYFDQMQNYVYSAQNNAYQMHENLIGDVYGRYMSITNTWFNSYATFNASDAWLNQTPFKDVLSNFYPAWIEVRNKTNSEGVIFAWAQLLRVAAMQRVTDIYGPIPYSKITGSNITVAYDSQEEVYNHLFEDLDFAIDELVNYVYAFPAEKPMANYDKVYGGDFSKWIKFANSLKLRMAVRIVYANPTLAKQKAEEAVSHPFGVIMSNDDNAAIGYEPNPIKIMWDDYTDTRVCADILSYMNGYNDPRRSAYFTKQARGGTSDWYGLRSGINITSKEAVLTYATPAIFATDKLMWLHAAEVAFLKAEGAMRGWNMRGTAEDLYNEGIQLSFAQYAVSGVATYIANTTSVPAACSDPDRTAAAVSVITIKWDGSASDEVKLERLITQKWIAMWPLGQEAWSDFRRTGYPRFFPVLVNRNTDATLTSKLAARIPYPPDEKITNAANYNSALTLLGGGDLYGTKVWWDKKTNKP